MHSSHYRVRRILIHWIWESIARLFSGGGAFWIYDRWDTSLHVLRSVFSPVTSVPAKGRPGCDKRVVIASKTGVRAPAWCKIHPPSVVGSQAGTIDTPQDQRHSCHVVMRVILQDVIAVKASAPGATNDVNRL